MTYYPSTIRNVLVDLAGVVTQETFTGHHRHYLEGLSWKIDFGLNSIQVLELAAHVNHLFHLFETDKKNYLLTDDQVDHWVNKIIDARKEKNEQLSFKTSGTSGASKFTTHTVAYLWREIEFLATFFKEATQIITYVPAHSIYGFLFTVLLPAKLGIPVLHASEVQWNQLSPQSVIVATPFYWSYILPAFSNLPIQCYGVSATSMLVPELKHQIEEQGVDLLDVYGSTETSGIGFRKKETAYQLFPYFSFVQNEAVLQIVDNNDNHLLPIQDMLKKQGDNLFLITGRIDNQVNVAGKLVDIEKVAANIRALENVADCKVSAKQVQYQTQLSAYVLLQTYSEQLRALAIQRIKEMLPAHETPVVFNFKMSSTQV
jgi:4-coumarate--CoA ligase (photoactive yellow protein activation family)